MAPNPANAKGVQSTLADFVFRAFMDSFARPEMILEALSSGQNHGRPNVPTDDGNSSWGTVSENGDDSLDSDDELPNLDDDHTPACTDHAQASRKSTRPQRTPHKAYEDEESEADDGDDSMPAHRMNSLPWVMPWCKCCRALGYSDSAQRERGIYHSLRLDLTQKTKAGILQCGIERGQIPDPDFSKQVPDVLARLPTEIRLMIFEALLVEARPFFRADPSWDYYRCFEYGVIRNLKQFSEVSRQTSVALLSTCHQYHKEGTAILYGKNELIFAAGNPYGSGYFERFPVARQYMPLVRSITILYHIGDPKSEDARKVAYFLSALAQFATKLESVTVCFAADRLGLKPFHYFLDLTNPVLRAVVSLMSAPKIQNLNIRFHGETQLVPYTAMELESIVEEEQSEQSESMPLTKLFRSAGFCLCHTHAQEMDEAKRWGVEEIPDIWEMEVDELEYEATLDELEERLGFSNQASDRGVEGDGAEDGDDSADEGVGDDGKEEQGDPRYPAMHIGDDEGCQASIRGYFKRIPDGDYYAFGQC